MRSLPSRALAVGVALLTACTAAPSASPRADVEDARAELRDLVTDVTAADGYRYKVADDLGRPMGPTKIIPIPEAAGFGAVYFTWSEVDASFHVQLATSTNLLDWTWQVELAEKASMPTIAAASDGGYVVAWEQEPDPIHIVIAHYADWDALRRGTHTRRFEVPITTPACGEGTPSIESASSQLVELGFHYHGDCVRDRQAGGSTDWATWEASTRPMLDEALIDLGVDGHIGDRESFTFRGHDLMLIEGQRTLDDWSSWRTFLYDAETDTAEWLDIRTHDGSYSIGNPSVTMLELDGRPAIVVTLYLFTEGSAPGEDEELIYYRFLDE